MDRRPFASDDSAPVSLALYPLRSHALDQGEVRMLGVRHTTKADPLAVIVVAECQYQRLGFPIAMRARNVGHVMRMALFLFF